LIGGRAWIDVGLRCPMTHVWIVVTECNVGYSNQIKSNLLMQKGQLATNNKTSRQYNSCKNSWKSLQKLNTSSVQQET